MSLYEYILRDNAKILKEIFKEKVTNNLERIEELVGQLNDNNEYIRNNFEIENN